MAELDVDSFDIFADSIGEKIAKLCTELEWSTILTISDCVAPILQQENSFRPAKEARSKLIKMGMADTYSGGVILNEQTIPTFFGNIFWIVRCNASAPDIVFSGPNSSIIGTLCKYGNIHFDCYDEAEKRKLKRILSNVGFNIAQDGIYHENYTTSDVIVGRKLHI